MLNAAEYISFSRNDFYTFMHRAFLELNPTAAFAHNWHIQLVASKLEACWRGQINRLIINMPPRSLKSHAATVAFPAFLLGHIPSAQILCASYAEDLAYKHSLDCRNLISSTWYKSLFPTRLSHQKQSAQEFVTTAGGFRLAASIGGTLTGRGADFIILDDPLKPQDALSESQRNAVNEWFTHTLYSRLNDKRRGCIIIVMQRLHEDDLVGHVLEQEKWDLVRLPAIAEEDETHVIDTPYGRKTVSRKAGEPLHPDREPLPVLDHLRRTLGTYNFAGQYQQQPAPLGGGMVKMEWFKFYRRGEESHAFELKFQSWDTAAKSTELNDFSVCTTWGLQGKQLFLLDVYRKRLEFPDLKRAVVQLATRHGAKTILIEDRSSGTQLIQDLVREGLAGVTRYEPKMDKVMRLHSVTSTIENGFVYLPERAEWLGDYIHELTTFPASRFDDQTDSTAQALDWVKGGVPCLGLIDYYKEEAARLGIFIEGLTEASGSGNVEDANKCPSCSCESYSRVGPQKRCSQCGHQWPPVRPEGHPLTRYDILNRAGHIAHMNRFSWSRRRW
jgi:predicted phage terminase large subunit-like protein